MRQATSTPVIQTGDRILALLPLRCREEPAAVVGIRRDGSLAVVLDDLPTRQIVCCDWRLPKRAEKGAAR